MKNTVGYAKTGAMVKRCFSPETLLKKYSFISSNQMV